MQTSNVETLLVGGEHSVGRGILVQLQRWLTHAFVHAPRMVSVTKRRPPSSRVVTGRRLFPEGGRASLRLTDPVITTKGVLMATYELDRD